MGGRYSVEARNLKDDSLQICWYGNSFLKFLFIGIKCMGKYDVVILGKHG